MNCAKILKNTDNEVQVRLLVKVTVGEEKNKRDATEGAIDVLSDPVKSAQEDFKQFIDADSQKKTLSKIFVLLLNTKINTLEKIKKILLRIGTHFFYQNNILQNNYFLEKALTQRSS